MSKSRIITAKITPMDSESLIVLFESVLMTTCEHVAACITFTAQVTVLSAEEATVGFFHIFMNIDHGMWGGFHYLEFLPPEWPEKLNSLHNIGKNSNKITLTEMPTSREYL